MEQLSFWDKLLEFAKVATCLWSYDTNRYEAMEPSERILRLVPNCKYVLNVGGHDLALRKAEIQRNEVPVGHEFYHYIIDGVLYSGIFVGGEA